MLKQKCNFALFMAVFYFVWMIRATLIYDALDQFIQAEGWRLVFSNVVKFTLWVLPAMGYIIRCNQEPVLKSLKVNTSVR